MSLKQEIETWVLALEHYDNQEYEEAIRIFGHIADTSKIFFNCGVIYATLGEHEKAVCLFIRNEKTAVSTNIRLGPMLPTRRQSRPVSCNCLFPRRRVKLPSRRF
jgi:hypothetical protein